MNYLKDISKWTFEYENLSIFLIGIPISFWFLFGLILILKLSFKYNNTLINSTLLCLFYLLTPVIYFLLIIYIGNLFFLNKNIILF